MDASEWVFLVAMIVVWLVGSALIGLFGIHLSNIENRSKRTLVRSDPPG